MKLAWTIVYVPDVEASIAFYERAFGLTRRFIGESGDYGEVETGATALGFARETFIEAQGIVAHRNRPDGTPSGVEIGFSTDDVPTALERAIEAGATLHHGPIVKPWGQIVAYVRDLNGLLIEIATPVEA